MVKEREREREKNSYTYKLVCSWLARVVAVVVVANVQVVIN